MAQATTSEKLWLGELGSRRRRSDSLWRLSRWTCARSRFNRFREQQLVAVDDGLSDIDELSSVPLRV
jgi:hypothetical protein